VLCSNLFNWLVGPVPSLFHSMFVR
jgi:hypothetical protein